MSHCAGSSSHLSQLYPGSSVSPSSLRPHHHADSSAPPSSPPAADRAPAPEDLPAAAGDGSASLSGAPSAAPLPSASGVSSGAALTRDGSASPTSPSSADRYQRRGCRPPPPALPRRTPRQPPPPMPPQRRPAATREVSAPWVVSLTRKRPLGGLAPRSAFPRRLRFSVAKSEGGRGADTIVGGGGRRPRRAGALLAAALPIHRRKSRWRGIGPAGASPMRGGQSCVGAAAVAPFAPPCPGLAPGALPALASELRTLPALASALVSARAVACGPTSPSSASLHNCWRLAPWVSPLEAPPTPPMTPGPSRRPGPEQGVRQLVARGAFP